MSYIGNPPVNGVFRKLDTIAASFNGSTTSFNLTSGGAAVTPGLTTNLIISLGGIIQEPNTAYTVSGSVLSFTAAPPAGTTFWGIQLGDVGLASSSLPTQSAFTTEVFTATAGQTTFTVAGGYTPGQIQILRNGVQLVVGVDVTATDTSTFVLTNAAAANDTLVSIAYTSFIVANAVQKNGDTMTGGLTAPTITTTSTATVGGDLLFNSGYGSAATAYGCRAWVNFNGAANSNLTGTYSQSGTTVTVTATDHGQLVGSDVYADITSGTGVDGTYTVTSVINSNSFTYTAGTSLTTSGNITLRRSTIRASANVANVANNGNGDYTVNFLTPIVDANYAVNCTATAQSGAAFNYSIGITDAGTYSTGGVRIVAERSDGAATNMGRVSVAIFR